MQECELFVAVDSEGNFVVNAEESDLDMGDLTGSVRIIRVILNVPIPKTTTVTATIPAQPDTAAIVAVA